MRLLLVRHGETEWNVQKIIQGRKDSKLTAKGRRQMFLVIKKLLKYKIDVIFTSPLGRTIKSAECIAERLGCSLEVDKRLIQKSWGVVEGLKREEVARKYPESGYGINGEIVDLKKRYYFLPPGGESWNDVYKRVKSFTKYLEKEYSDKNVLIIAHRPISRLIIGIYLGLSVQQMTAISVEAGVLTRIDIKDKKEKLVLLNGKRFFKKVKLKI